MSTTGDKILDTALSKVKVLLFLDTRIVFDDTFVDFSFVIHVPPFVCRLGRRASSPKS